LLNIETPSLTIPKDTSLTPPRSLGSRRGFAFHAVTSWCEPRNDITLKQERFGNSDRRDIDGWSRRMQVIVIVFAAAIVFVDIGYTLWSLHR
jgi:hypothetical protein